jgi:iron(III) transport system substrate-binding protein
MVALLAVSSWAAPSKQTLQELERAAKAEGEVIWQVVGSAPMWQPAADAFHAKYPDIKVTVFSAGASEMPGRIITEAKANKISLDVGNTNPEFMLSLIERDLVVKYDWTKTSDMEPSAIVMDGLLVNLSDNPMVWAYNTKLVSKGDMPRSWEDLLHPRWKGFKITMLSNGQQVNGLLPEWRKNPEKVKGYLEKLRDQQIMSTPRIMDSYQRVANGECLIGVFRIAGYETMKEQGAPLALCPISPAAATPTGAMLIKGAPHPNAGKLLISWLAGPEGRAQLLKISFGKAEPCDASSVAKLLCDHGLQFVRLGRTLEEVKELRDFVAMATKTLGFAP